MNKKIQQLEEETKNLHYNPIQIGHDFSEKSAQEMFTNFWDYHIPFVIKKSRELAVKYKADEEIAWASAILHDIARLDNAEPHDEIGSEKAYNILIEKGFKEDFAKKVKDIILTHRCKKYPPENLEQKILATADAMSHFLTPFYFWIAKDFKQTFKEMLEKDLVKIERDYNNKIFFEDEKKEVEKCYEVIKNWCKYEK